MSHIVVVVIRLFSLINGCCACLVVVIPPQSQTAGNYYSHRTYNSLINTVICNTFPFDKQ